ncbi:MAG: hypothetical protein KY429_04445 [Actinobacteria bacterium]|nr:hypothetical protein [Actinomycetota bacterium]
MDRRVFLKLGVLSAAGLVLPSCRSQRPPIAPREVPPDFRELADQLRVEPTLDMFLGAKEFLAGSAQRIPFAIVDGRARPLEKQKITVHAAGSGRVTGPFQAKFVEFATGSLHSHSEETEPGSPFESSGFYQALVELPAPGFWQLMASIDSSEPRAGFAAMEVLATSKVPSAGQPAVAVDTPVVSDPKGAAYVCTQVPACSMHSVSLKDALEGQQPVVYVVATPRFCRSRLCGPVVAEIEQVRANTSDVTFVHAEVYTDEQAKTVAPAMTAWGLDSEPWTFLINADGTVASSFEGPVVSSQVEDALQKVLA